MSAFQFQDICYPDAESAKGAWLSQYPTPPDGSGHVWFLVGSSVPNASGIFYADIAYYLNGVTQLSTIEVRFPSCTPDVAARVFDKFPIQDLILPMALVVVFVLGFGQGKSSL